MGDPRHAELGSFLRSRREKLTPQAIGITAGRRRRATGLRREEVAELAGIGVDWYIRLEQGRAVKPSSSTIDALARALRLSTAEHAHLKALAQDPARKPFVREEVPAGLRQLVQSLNQPAYISGRRWDVLAWNDAADEIFGFSRLADDERNTLLLMLCKPGTRRLFGAQWKELARRMVAQFRATYDLWAGDPAFVDLVARLRRGSREFDELWAAHDVNALAAGEKLLEHPKKGRVRLRYATFQANDDPALKLAIYYT
ncbi:transcriptional regulator [Bradyrhizobium sp. SSBR45G]|uniref:helix-turn-helix transcriptional regulator n=1 Tax=unclassified Bradyrhizobium TaxID=2631580 RepID=UPI002342A035|nr:MULTISPECIES: helix-turn-helix transcriptional regulator [unclassified Bradyrhizobium]GLH75890.1 transcriptional regulator [Bradyrhizobium sp. SSBR45G]GLH85127.1 transcriptional regulator [Bradyrhizobium sp. SSBR45R]